MDHPDMLPRKAPLLNQVPYCFSRPPGDGEKEAGPLSLVFQVCMTVRMTVRKGRWREREREREKDREREIVRESERDMYPTATP
jgi:hypothetical protein